MGSLRSRVETWIRDQATKAGVTSWGLPAAPPLPRWRWPPWGGGEDRRERERRLKEEFERQRRQLLDLCGAVKAESIHDLQEILCCMVLSECVYKRPATEMIQFINKSKSDFGGQIVSLERVQPSLDHVPHRYLLAVAGDTLFASFIGTKQYRDVIADVNILQGAIFHEDDEEVFDGTDFENDQVDTQSKTEGNPDKVHQAKPKQLNNKVKPAAHRGFLARAKGIPALELYKLAQKKNMRLVLCGHSLGGAVAALATLAILRLLVSSPIAKDHEKVPVKCITFSQPPVGNDALRDYVHRKGWQHYFRTYCIPEDLVPRILSPAYFHHYNAQAPPASSDEGLAGTSFTENEHGTNNGSTRKHKENGEQLVLGLGPIQTSFWRLSKLVPLESVRKQLNIYDRAGNKFGGASEADINLQSAIDETEAEPQPLEIREGSDGISLNPLPDIDSREENGSQIDGKMSAKSGDSRLWRRVPYMPSYVPFGQLYLLRSSSVDLLSDAEYSKLASVKSVITEMRKRFQSHSMKSYRSRFQRIYELCMGINSSFLGMEQLPQFPHLQQLLGLPAANDIELGHIVEPPVIHTATSIIPLGWRGVAGDKNADHLKVDIVGHGLHLCTLVQAQVNGNWHSTAVESLPSMPPHSSNHGVQPDLQKMRVLIGTRLRRQPKHPVMEGSLLPGLSSRVMGSVHSRADQKTASFCEEKRDYCEGLNDFVVYCTSDFVTVCKEVHVRARRVRLLGFQGAGKSSLLTAIVKHGRQVKSANQESILPQLDTQEAMVGGVCFLDSPGVSLQELHVEASHFKNELEMGLRVLNKKTDLIILVHNLSHNIPWNHQSNASQPQPSLSLLLDEAKALGISWVLAITNKFSVSAHQQKMLINSAMEAYQASPSMTEIVNSCPFVIPSSQPLSLRSERKALTQNLMLVPINLARMPFQKKAVSMPVEGVHALCQLVHHVLRSQEEMAFEELVNERLSVELAREQKTAAIERGESQGKGNAITAAAVGASLGAGLGLVMAVVMGAGSALRKP